MLLWIAVVGTENAKPRQNMAGFGECALAKRTVGGTREETII